MDKDAVSFSFSAKKTKKLNDGHKRWSRIQTAELKIWTRIFWDNQNTKSLNNLSYSGFLYFDCPKIYESKF